ncbi:MAG: glycosyltransferase [bacterium]|nr:glycosyltransferase [bacterium]
MRIVVLSTQLPRLPGPGGETRCFGYLRELRARHSFTLLTSETGFPEERAALEAMGIRVVPMAPGGESAAEGPLLFPDDSRLPGAVREVGRLQGTARRLIREAVGEGADIVQVEQSPNAVWLDGSGVRLPAVLVLYDVKSLYHARLFAAARGIAARARAFREWMRMRAYERRVCGLFRSLVVPSEKERRALRALTGREDIAVVPNGVDTAFFSPMDVAPRPRSMIYTGGLFWPPNQEAVIRFARRVLPLVWREFPDATFTVVGPRAPAALAALASDRRIEIVDTEGDQRPYIARAAVYVVPLLVGAGTRVKILEAMAMGRPVVSTPIGCEGHPLAPGTDILVANGDRDFARCVSLLFRDGGKAEAVGRAGLEFVRRTSDYRILAPAMERVYASLAPGAPVGGRGRPAAGS